MIATSQALPTLERMLADAGFDRARPDAALAWRTFKAFSAVQVAAATDGLLFQCGTYAFSGEPMFEFDFTRQFGREEDGEPAGIEQLNCTILFAPTDALRSLQTNLWSFSYRSSEEFFAAVEALPEFSAGLAAPNPVGAVIRQEEI